MDDVTAMRRQVAGLLIGGGLLLAGLAPQQVSSEVGPLDPVGGVVYLDSNADGVRGAAELGEPGLTVTAVDASGNSVASVTDQDGSYSLDLTGFDGGTVRVELGALPDHLEAAPHGPSNNGTVSFVGPGTTVDIGVTNPDEHCQSNPRLVVSCFAMGGDQSRSLYSTTSVMNSAYNIDADSRTPGNDPKVTTATQEEIGSVGGAAYQRSSRTQFWGAYLKRHAPFGPGGPGAIYRLAPGPDGEAGTADDVPSLYLDVNSMFPGNPAGVDPRPPGYADWIHDTTFAQVSTTGWGDLEMSSDGRYLLAVNLGDRHLYRIDTRFDPSLPPTAAEVVRTPVPLPPSCPPNDVRPFGLGTHEGTAYVGSVCSAETTNSRDALRAYVHTFDPDTATFAATPVLDESLAFQRGCASRNPITLTCDTPQIDRYWNPWRPTFVPAEWSTTNFIFVQAISRPMPILGDIDFIGDSMVLGFRDRGGDQIGYRTQVTADGPFLIGTTGGDQMRACRTPDGSWTFESNAASPAGCLPAFSSSAGAGNDQGPGGGEFYFADTSTSVLDEISFGMIATIPGSGETAFTTLDPRGTQLEGGIRWYSDTTGNTSRIVSNSSGTPKEVNHQYTVYNAEAEFLRFGKANGLGDLEALCDEAPLEIGNRIWFDADDDGVQTPGEPGIPGVTVTLHDRDGVLLATAITDAAGQYWFASAGDPNVGPDPGPEFGIVAAGIDPLTDYEIRVAVATADLTGIVDVAPSALELADRDQGGSDTVDSDADDGAAYDRIAVTTGRVGESDHTFDAGYFAVPEGTPTTTTSTSTTTTTTTSVPETTTTTSTTSVPETTTTTSVPDTTSTTTSVPETTTTTSVPDTTSTTTTTVPETTTTTEPVAAPTSTSSTSTTIVPATTTTTTVFVPVTTEPPPPSVAGATTVAPPPPKAPSSAVERRLAVTGTSSWTMLVVGVGAIALGLQLLFVDRLRRSRRH